MDVLVINCGSSSLKYQLINTQTEEVLASGICDRIGIKGGQFSYKPKDGSKTTQNVEMPDHEVAIKLVLNALVDPKDGILKSLDEIKATGHRIVHGGEHFTESALVNDEVIRHIEECADLAPLHNPAHLLGIRACQHLMPNKPMVAVFDTAFHQTMPPRAYIYGLPYEYYEKYKIRRYGFHGTSHSYVSKRTAEFLGIPLENSKIITCHLGNGSSICAIENGKSIDTSMGLTPLEGLVMGTRSGDLDPAIIDYIAQKENLNTKEVINILNKKSGVLGISGISSDFRDLLAADEEGNLKARFAREVFAYHVAKYIGSYTAALTGVDAITFCAGVGENAKFIRGKIVSHLQFLGITLDEKANLETIGKEGIISTKDSKVKVCVIPTNEELMIARDTRALVAGKHL
ncbi:acetate/propionate family kinase [Helicobacter winghamensis]|uniref:acetate/propionate family kinase n=1 Tax=Helicobacter winghamensis TaxID=157268 RepID=UPI0001A290DB|nr:acetate kinase [Helicobacter winghamensis]EEO26318.1 acetate kinase [Helicobacter winghamensis ATCC BAA-430]PKT77505.1 acetate kinase [Helicobacter winghamensis]PKT77762.1 acetate kinase [Helicobacter winghamensis]